MIGIIFGRRYNLIDQVVAMVGVVLVYTTHLPIWAIALGAAVVSTINLQYEVYYEDEDES